MSACVWRLPHGQILVFARRLSGMLVALVVLSGVWCASAGAVSRVAVSAGRVRVVSPAAGAVVLGRSARVAVAVGSGVREFAATVNGRSVTVGFAAHGSLRVAVLRQARAAGLRFGKNTVDVRARDRAGRERYAQVSFVLARLGSGLIGGVAARPACGAGASLRVALTRAGLGVRFWVNGRGHGLVGSGRVLAISLDADHGLRPGVNVVVVRALDRTRGVFSVRRVRLVMPGTAPIAGAGAPRLGTVRQVIRFSAAASVARRGMRLRYRWVIVRRPRGSRARLRDASTAHPFLRPDRPGRYTAQVTVTPITAPATPVAGLGRVGLPCAARGSSDTTTLAASVPIPPIGVPVDTIATQKGQLGIGVTVGGAFFAAPDSSEALQLLVLDRYTLAEVNNQSFTNGPVGTDALISAVGALPTGDDAPLVIITKPDPTVSNVNEDQTAGTSGQLSRDRAAINIATALKAIGVSDAQIATAHAGGPPDHVEFGDTPCPPSQGKCSTFSAIGIPGVKAGEASFSPGLAAVPSSGQAGGDLHGFFARSFNKTSAALGYPLVFLNRDRVPFDTGDPTANPAVITVGSNEAGSPVQQATYRSATLAPGQSGFYVLALDAGSLKVLAGGGGTYTTGNPSEDSLVGNMQDMADFLGSFATDPSALVIVRSIGKAGQVKPVLSWDRVAARLAQLGGSQYYFNALDGTNSSAYAQVGPELASPGYPNPLTQVAIQQRTGTGRLTGLLARDSTSQWYPDESVAPSTTPGETPTLASTLPGLVSLPATTWPDRSTPADQAVIACIAAHIDRGAALPLLSPGAIQDDYTDTSYVGDWASWGQSLDPDLHPEQYTYYSKLSGCDGFTQSDWNAVAGQLSKEFQDIPPVLQLIINLKAPYLETGTGADINSIVTAVNTSLENVTAKATVDPLAVSSDVFWILSAVPGPQSNFLNAVAGSFALADALNVQPSGKAQPSVNEAGAALGVALAGRYNAAIKGLDSTEGILLGDWNKLQIAAHNALNSSPGKTADWNADYDARTGDTPETDANDQLELSVKRAAYQALFPAAYNLYRLQAGTGSLDANDPTKYPCQRFTSQRGPRTTTYTAQTWYPFSGAQTYGSTPVIITPGFGTPVNESWVFANNPGVGDNQTNATTPDESLLTSMFSEPQNQAPNNLGFPGPLFNPLQLALEAYAGGSNAQTITHIQNTAGNGIQTVANYCTTS